MRPEFFPVLTLAPSVVNDINFEWYLSNGIFLSSSNMLLIAFFKDSASVSPQSDISSSDAAK